MCSTSLLDNFTPNDRHHGAVYSGPRPDLNSSDFMTRHQPKVRIEPYAFLGADYDDFLIFNLLFKDMERPGVFVEAGGLDGVDESNTWFFEKYLNWTGLLIEPTICAVCHIPDSRLRSIAHHGAICGPSNNRARRHFNAAEMQKFCDRSFSAT